MQTFKRLDEDLLVSRSESVGVRIDAKLPLRFQKRNLLRSIGFPIDNSLCAFRSREIDSIRSQLGDCLSSMKPFQVIVSEKPIITVCTPLFLVKNGQITFRDRHDQERWVSGEEMIAEISALTTESWVEFANVLWNSNTVAGHLIYQDAEVQLLEIQQGVVPAQIGRTPNLPYFTTDLRFFSCEESYNYDRMKLRELGFRFGICRKRVEGICYDLWSLAEAFKTLKAVSSWPTLEFAYTGQGKFVTLDVDWPAEWYRAGKIVKK